jgi:hypothetical protein
MKGFMTIKIDEDKCIQYYSKLNLDHSSPSQEAMDDALWLVNYCYWDQEKRRQKNVSFRMVAGVSIGRASQRFAVKYFYDAEKKMINEKQSLDKIIEDELKQYDSYQPHSDLDREQHQDTREYLVSMIKITCTALKDIKLEDESAAERYCTHKFDGLVLPKLGRLDYEDRKKFIELKTKHRSKRKSDTKAGFSWTKGYLPKTADENHLKQVAFYFHCTGKIPYLLYVNQDSFNVFTQDSCEQLKPDYLKFLVDQDYKKARVRQNIVIACEGDVRRMAQLIPPPNFSSYMWRDLQPEMIEDAASLWDNI